NLSQFGESDLIVLCELKNGDKAIVFCEFKRASLKLTDEWQAFFERIQKNRRENLTSNLFCQLYFKQRFCQALVDPSDENIHDGLEFDEPLNISRGNRRRKIGKNTQVLE